MYEGLGVSVKPPDEVSKPHQHTIHERLYRGVSTMRYGGMERYDITNIKYNATMVNRSNDIEERMI